MPPLIREPSHCEFLPLDEFRTVVEAFTDLHEFGKPGPRAVAIPLRDGTHRHPH